MNNVLILLDNPDDWKPYCETKSILTVSDYLKNKPVEKDRKLVINLSNDYSYNSEGYYCSLLAQTRGQKVIPDVDIINKMEAGRGCGWTVVCKPFVINGYRRMTSRMISGT